MSRYISDPQAKLNSQVVGKAVSDYLAIRIFYIRKDRHIRLSAMFFYRKVLQKNHIYGLTKDEIRSKVRRMLCNRLRKINFELHQLKLFLQDCDGFAFATSPTGRDCKETYEKLQSLPPEKLLELYKAGLITTKIDFRHPAVFY